MISDMILGSPVRNSRTGATGFVLGFVIQEEDASPHSVTYAVAASSPNGYVHVSLQAGGEAYWPIQQTITDMSGQDGFDEDFIL